MDLVLLSPSNKSTMLLGAPGDVESPVAAVVQEEEVEEVEVERGGERG